jgi:hypothetical protein
MYGNVDLTNYTKLCRTVISTDIIRQTIFGSVARIGSVSINLDQDSMKYRKIHKHLYHVTPYLKKKNKKKTMQVVLLFAVQSWNAIRLAPTIYEETLLRVSSQDIVILPHHNILLNVLLQIAKLTGI